MQSVYITTKIVSLNPVHDKEYSIQYYVIKFVQQLAAGQWFSPGTPVSSINKNDHHDITEILLKVVLNTINPPPSSIDCKMFSYHVNFILCTKLICHVVN